MKAMLIPLDDRQPLELFDLPVSEMGTLAAIEKKVRGFVEPIPVPVHQVCLIGAKMVPKVSRYYNRRASILATQLYQGQPVKFGPNLGGSEAAVFGNVVVTGGLNRAGDFSELPQCMIEAYHRRVENDELGFSLASVYMAAFLQAYNDYSHLIREGKE